MTEKSLVMDFVLIAWDLEVLSKVKKSLHIEVVGGKASGFSLKLLFFFHLCVVCSLHVLMMSRNFNFSTCFVTLLMLYYYVPLI